MATIGEFLLKYHIVDEQVLRAVANLGIETRDDLAYLFTSRDQAGDLADVWELARGFSQAAACSLAEQVILSQRAAPGVTGSSRPVSSSGGPGADGSGLDRDRRRRGLRRGTVSIVGKRPRVTLRRRDPLALDPSGDRLHRRTVAGDLLSGATWVPVEDQPAVVDALANFEVAVLRSRQRSWRRWSRFCSTQSVSPATAPTKVVQAFLDSQTAATAAGALWDALRWMVQYVRVPLDLPRRPHRLEVDGCHREPRQAVVFEPEMVMRLEKAIQRLSASVSALLGIALAAWVCLAGCLRFTHIQRARPIGRSRSSLLLYIYRGKSRVQGVRAGYIARVPRRGLLHGQPADRLWDLWHKRCSECSFHGMAFDHTTGEAVSLTQFTTLLRTILDYAEAADNSDLVTSYSLRRFLPTCADVVQVPLDIRHALGWRHTGATLQTGLRCMPIRYSGQRGETEEYVKLLLMNVIRQVTKDHPGEVVTWDLVRHRSQPWDSMTHRTQIEEEMDGDIEWSPLATLKERALLPKKFKLSRLRAVSDQRGPITADGGCHGASKRHRASQATPHASQGMSGPEVAVGAMRRWIACGGRHDRIHFLPQAGEETLCSEMGRRPQSEALVKGEGFRMALSFGKRVCKACLKKLPIQEQAEVEAIQARGAERAEETFDY